MSHKLLPNQAYRRRKPAETLWKSTIRDVADTSQLRIDLPAHASSLFCVHNFWKESEGVLCSWIFSAHWLKNSNSTLSKGRHCPLQRIQVSIFFGFLTISFLISLALCIFRLLEFRIWESQAETWPGPGSLVPCRAPTPASARCCRRGRLRGSAADGTCSRRRSQKTGPPVPI